MSMKHVLKNFDPNAPGRGDSGIFGLPFSVEEAACVVLPVPWEVTVSYGGGTVEGPDAVLAASRQVDLYEPDFPGGWKSGIAMDRLPEKLKRESKRLRRIAEGVIAALESGIDKGTQKQLAEVNRGCQVMVDHVCKRAGELLDAGKQVALLGGDHSTPLGFLEALAERHKSFGILQIDAHADLREAYEGFMYSHASIMFNALKLKPVKNLVQVGIRDYCDEELAVMRREKARVTTFFDRDLKRKQYVGKTVAELHRKIVKTLPAKVYISFDIDGLDPKLCPHTGTPVPGGLEFEEAMHLVRCVVESGRTIIGLDVNEVSPGADEWDANVGARLLYRMINLMMKSRSA
jgi:agmatinase